MSRRRARRTALATGLVGLISLIAALVPVPTLASAQPASGPWVEVANHGWDPDTVTVFGWPDETAVTVQVDHEDDGSFDQETTQLVAEAGTTFVFQRQQEPEDSEQQGSLPPGARVRATGWDGSQDVVRELLVPDFRIEYADPLSDVVAGHAPEGTLVRVALDADPQTWLEDDADADGLWSVDFAGVHDVAEGEALRAEMSDTDGNEVVSGAQAMAPTITAPVDEAQSFVAPWGWPYGTPVTVTVDTDANGTPESITTEAVWPMYFRMGTFPVSTYPPGTVITATGRSGGTKVLVVDQLTVDVTDVMTDTVSGTAAPGATVIVDVDGTQRTVVAAADGTWTTPSFNPPVDLANPPPYQWASATIVDDDGDSTSSGRTVASPIFTACVGGDFSGCFNGAITPMYWDIGVPLTAEIDTDANGTVDHTFGAVISNGNGPSWSVPDRNWMVDGSTVRVSGGGVTRELTVRALRIEAVDPALDEVRGTGPAGTTVRVQLGSNTWPPPSLEVTVGADGSWTAPFAPFDILPGSSASVYLADPDGDLSTASGQHWQPMPLLTPAPDTDLTDGQVIDITGDYWPYDPLQPRQVLVNQCRTDVALNPDACDGTLGQNYPIASDGTISGQFTVKATLSLSGDRTFDCTGGACGLVALVPNPAGGFPLAIDMPNNNVLLFGQGTLTAVAPGTGLPATDLVADADGVAQVTVHAEGLSPDTEVSIRRCEASGDPATALGFNQYLCGNVDGSPALDEYGVLQPAPEAYRTTTDATGGFTLTIDVPEVVEDNDRRCGTNRLCKLIVTAASGPGASADPDGNEARIQFRLPGVFNEPGIRWDASPFFGTGAWLSTDEGASLSDVRPWNHAPPVPAAPDGVDFPIGTVAFTVHVAEPGDSTMMVLQTTAAFNAYYALVDDEWEAFPLHVCPDEPTPGAPTATQYEVTDGGLGDLDGVADGVIHHMGAAAMAPDDADGVLVCIENAAPNWGDGNYDGVLDSAQDEVVSLPGLGASSPSDSVYLTLASDDGTALADVDIVDPEPLAPPEYAELPLGLVNLTVLGVEPGATVDVEVFIEGDRVPDEYWKYQGDAWIDYSEHVDLTTNPIVVSLADRTDELPGLGDQDPTPGVIVDPGGPVFGPRSLLRFARADLLDLEPGLHPDDLFWVDKAIEALDDALTPDRWASPIRLDPQTGDETFDDIRLAVTRLEKATSSPEVAAVVLDLVDVARLLAETAVADARAAGDDTRRIDRAERQLLLASAELAAGRPDKAISRYATAWELATG